MKKQPKPKHARPAGGRLLLYYDEQTAAALEIIANGNKSEAIRRAIHDAASAIQLTESLARMDRGERLDQSKPR
jgi:hypothetical protein